MWIVALLVLCSFVPSHASFDPIKYTGSLQTNSPQFNPPSWDSREGATCTASMRLHVYKWFTVNLTEAGVWQVLASAEESIQKDFKVYIYTGFDPSLPCTGLLRSSSLTRQLVTTLTGPIINDFVYLHHSYYIFVVAAPTDQSGSFGINILPSLMSGTTVGSPLWPIVVINSGVCEAYTITLSTPFAYYTWTQPSSGLFDILIMFDGSGSNWFSFLALYNTGLTWQQLQTPCNRNGAGRFLQATSNSVPAKGAGVWNQALTAKANYTIAFSGYGSSQVGYYGIRIVPTQVRKPFQTSFVQPQRGISQCYADPYNDDSSWDAILFNAENSVYMIDTASVVPPLTPFDTYSFLYEGQNSASPPTGCPHFARLVAQADTGDFPLAYHTSVGTNYTAIISTFSGSQTGTGRDYAYLLYVITGHHIPDSQPPYVISSGSLLAPFYCLLVLCLFM